MWIGGPSHSFCKVSGTCLISPGSFGSAQLMLTTRTFAFAIGTFSALLSPSFTHSDVFHTAFDTWKSDWDFAAWDSKLQEEAMRLSQIENLPSDDYDKSDRQELPPTRSFQDNHPFDMFCDCLNCVSALSEIMDGGGVFDTYGVAYDGGEELCETEEDFMYEL